MGDIIGGGVRDLSLAQRSLQQQSEILSKLIGEHAETTALHEASARIARPRPIGTTRDFCDAAAKRSRKQWRRSQDLVPRYSHRRTACLNSMQNVWNKDFVA